jgi:ligand-binding SRPBCC domain-containing protein
VTVLGSVLIALLALLDGFAYHYHAALRGPGGAGPGGASRSGKIARVQPFEISARSELAAPPQAVWERVTTIAGINHELGPWMRMTAPRGAELSLDSVPLGRRWFRSWVLLLGVLPCDYDDLCIERLDPARGFLERSRMFSATAWEHERTLDPLAGGGTRVTDRVGFRPRIRLLGAVHRAVIAAIFRHRHRRLRAFFGNAGAVADSPPAL